MSEGTKVEVSEQYLNDLETMAANLALIVKVDGHKVPNDMKEWIRQRCQYEDRNLYELWDAVKKGK